MTTSRSQLQPCLAELLRTCVKPKPIVLQIARIVTQETTADDTNPKHRPPHTPRFYLTDGELCIQALLQPKLLTEHEVKVGDIVEVNDFGVRKAKRVNGNGKIVYLGVQNFSVLKETPLQDWADAGGFLRDIEHTEEPSPKRRRLTPPPSTQTGVGLIPKLTSNMKSARSEQGTTRTSGRKHAREASTDSESDFESAEVSLSQIQKRRQALNDLRQPEVSPAEGLHTKEDQPSSVLKAQHDTQAVSSVNTVRTPVPPSNPDPPPTDIAVLSKPTQPPPPVPTILPPYHPLSTLLTKPPQTPISLLTIVTYVSPNILTKPSSPFPPKRNIKLLDPSLSTHPLGHYYPQGVMLAVYKDARSFKPAVGSVVLVRGVVVQRVRLRDGPGTGREGLIMNVYGNVQEKLEGMANLESGGAVESGGGGAGAGAARGVKWVETDEEVLERMGWDVKGLKGWWEERCKDTQK